MSDADDLGYTLLGTVFREEADGWQVVNTEKVQLYRCPRCHGAVDGDVLREHADWHEQQS